MAHRRNPEGGSTCLLRVSGNELLTCERGTSELYFSGPSLGGPEVISIDIKKWESALADPHFLVLLEPLDLEFRTDLLFRSEDRGIDHGLHDRVAIAALFDRISGFVEVLPELHRCRFSLCGTVEPFGSDVPRCPRRSGNAVTVFGSSVVRVKRELDVA